jgi:hypothetical protein
MMPPQAKPRNNQIFSKFYFIFFLKYIKKERQKSAEQPPGTIHSSI